MIERFGDGACSDGGQTATLHCSGLVLVVHACEVIKRGPEAAFYDEKVPIFRDRTNISIKAIKHGGSFDAIQRNSYSLFDAYVLGVGYVPISVACQAGRIPRCAGLCGRH